MARHARHTPAPWDLWSDQGGFEISVDSRRKVLAARAPWFRMADESHANGRLMHAAPDLYAALKDLVIAYGCDSSGEEPCGECLGCRGGAALAKAEGP